MQRYINQVRRCPCSKTLLVEASPVQTLPTPAAADGQKSDDQQRRINIDKST
jgi:hypothetical protein